MFLLRNLLRQLLEFYGVPPELLLQWCEACLNGIARRIEPHLPSSISSGTHLQQLYAISRNYLSSWAWKRKQYGSTRSLVRRLGKILSLAPYPSPRFQLVRSLNALELEPSRPVSSVTLSLADGLWMADDDIELFARCRFDQWKEVVPPSILPIPATSKGRAQKATVVNEDAFKKISALEDELAHLRAQIAAIVTVRRNKDNSSSDTVSSSSSPCNTLPKPPMTSTPTPISLCDIPPPPPLPAGPSAIDSHTSTIELIKQRRAASKIRNIADSSGWQKVQTVPSMRDVLKDINKVKLRAVERSPGGTPLPKSKKTIRSQWDPAAVIAEALKEKFASQSNASDSFDKENISYDASPFSSPDTPMVGRHTLKPSVKQTLNRAEKLIKVSPTKARVQI
ncbi:mitochondrial fission regulator 2 isoform X2 [Hemicordylus capensis]|uniref:mitochondrial fission regulator 2 isoform X2 n=1 Tax=Hemicordylus capensis TaxID=884348 RepID=UPI0023027039|nr:mitochondrial fission regulator 2 isoform X2 [Hemicordylus capensis]